jgi:hypothetical protein
LREHHQRLRDLPRRLLAVVVLEQGECEVDPAVTPAEVNIVPSRTKIASGSTVMSGWPLPRTPV